MGDGTSIFIRHETTRNMGQGRQRPRRQSQKEKDKRILALMKDLRKNLISLTQEDLPLQNKQHNEHSLQQNCSQEDEEG